MAFLHRIGKSKLKIVCTQFRACYIQLPHASTPKPCPLEMPHPYWPFHDRPTSFCSSVRFFAAPAQFQPKFKKEEDDFGGPRLNEQIKSQYVRLVMDDGHSIVSRFEALERARKLKLDLVEVQKNANPPVCKIMDFHKETYKQQEKEKERTKSKSEVTLRKGECKEVRFSEKTELKDLKMKADMVKRLMDKGYRVKCRSTGSENQDLTGPLSRLLDLIEDVAVVESGPNLARKEAFVIVRHVRYGPSKKGGGKKLQDAARMGDKAEESFAESEEELLSDADKDRNSSKNVNGTPSPDHQTETFFLSRTNDSVPPAESENRYRRADHPSGNKARPNDVTENRYKRAADPRNRFQQTTFNKTDAERNLNQMRHVPVDINGSRKPMPSHGYGIFSAQKGPETQPGMHRNRHRHESQ